MLRKAKVYVLDQLLLERCGALVFFVSDAVGVWTLVRIL
jgi:hypothetical protein